MSESMPEQFKQLPNDLPHPRFVRMEHPPGDREDDPDYVWWLDLWRPLGDEATAEQQYVAVQTEAGKDANDYRSIKGPMQILFTDQAEWSIVCFDCRMKYGRFQWSGGTRGRRGWRQRAEDDRVRHQREKGWCEFCDPVFGNGGWIL